MALFLISLLAGILTVLSPCVLPFLPIIVGGSIAGGKSIRRALTVTIALGVSVFAFTFILKVSTAFIQVPAEFWNILSGTIVIVVGLLMLFPKLYDLLPFLAKFNQKSSMLMNDGFKKQNFWGDVVIGAALGPVFSSCSPTYFILLASVLPVSLVKGVIDVLAYVVGLCVFLFIISVAGQKLLEKLNIASDPNGWFKRAIGALFILVGILVLSGAEATIEAPLYSIFDETKVEQGLLHSHSLSSALPVSGAEMATTTATASSTAAVNVATSSEEMGMLPGSGVPASEVVSPPSAATLAYKSAHYQIAPELVMPDAYLNTGGKPITLAEYRERNVVLIDFWTYSCINCQRTLPYVTSWYAKYKDQGLVVIGVHTPEFAFEHVESNVAAALKQFGITYPVVLDNEYKTWDAFNNEYWPQEYLVDIDGFIVHSHSGEGEYAETEQAIQAALAERATRLGESTSAIDQSLTSMPDPDLDAIQSPETYFGSNRNQYLGNGTPGQSGTQLFTIASGTLQANTLYLGGSWDIEPEYAQTTQSGDTIEYTYDAHDLYFVASGVTPVQIEVFRDGQPVGQYAGADVNPTTSMATISADRLYSLVHDTTAGVHTITIKVLTPGLQGYTFDFG